MSQDGGNDGKRLNELQQQVNRLEKNLDEIHYGLRGSSKYNGGGIRGEVNKLQEKVTSLKEGIKAAQHQADNAMKYAKEVQSEVRNFKYWVMGGVAAGTTIAYLLMHFFSLIIPGLNS